MFEVWEVRLRNRGLDGVEWRARGLPDGRVPPARGARSGSECSSGRRSTPPGAAPRGDGGGARRKPFRPDWIPPQIFRTKRTASAQALPLLGDRCRTIPRIAGFPTPTPERCQERRRGVRPCALGQSADAARREVGACGLMQPRQMRACRQGETHRRGRHQAAPRCRATCGGRAARRLHLDRRHRQDPVRVPPRQSRDRAGHRAKPTPLHRSCARHSGTRWQLSFAGSSAPYRITVGPFGGNAAPGAGYG